MSLKCLFDNNRAWAACLVVPVGPILWPAITPKSIETSRENRRANARLSRHGFERFFRIGLTGFCSDEHIQRKQPWKKSGPLSSSFNMASTPLFQVTPRPSKP